MQARQSSGERQRELYQLAEAQGGYFTIRELMETESGVMTKDAYWPIAPITRPKPP
jgi:hypothetical protein